MKIRLIQVLTLVTLILTIFGNEPVFADVAPIQAQLPSTKQTATTFTQTTPVPEKVETPTPTQTPKPEILLYPIEVQEFEASGKGRLSRFMN